MTEIPTKSTPRPAVRLGLPVAPAAPATLVALVTLTLTVAVGVARAADPSAPVAPAERIAEGVAAGGFDLGGLTVAEAAALLERRLGALASRPVAVWAAGHKFRLGAARARLVFDPVVTAKRALYAGRKLEPATQTGESTGGGGARPKPRVDVDLAIAWSKRAVEAWVAAVARRVERSAQSAGLRIGIVKLTRRRSRTGVDLDGGALVKAILARYADPVASRRLRRKVRKVHPAVTDADLAKAYPVVLTVDRHNFKLRLFKRLALRRTYGIALGAVGFDTPAGLFRIHNRQIDPPWTAPKKAWAGAYAGKTVPGGAPDNPLKARWLGIANGVGIHGTSQEWSIGSRASHGCIRMRVAEVKLLYPQVPVGTPVRISR